MVLLRYNPGSESTEQREKGFLETLAKEYPQIKVISSDQYAGTTPESSLDKATDVLNKYQDRVTGMFAVCEPNANGVLGALENTGLAGKVKALVFDPSPALIKGLAEGKVHGIVLQDPVTMGYLGVKTMVAHLEGNNVEKRIVTGEYVATPENMAEEQMKTLLGAGAVPRRRRAAGNGEVSHCRHPQGHDARVLEVGPRRRGPGRQRRPATSKSSGKGRCRKTIPKARSMSSRNSSRRKWTAWFWPRSIRRPWSRPCKDAKAAGNSHRDLRQRPGRREHHCQLRRHRQLPRRRAGRPPAGRSAGSRIETLTDSGFSNAVENSQPSSIRGSVAPHDGDLQAVWRHAGLARRFVGATGRPGAGADRRERRRQKHADEGAQRRPRAR